MNVTIRAATPDDARQIATVHVASWRTTYRGIVPDDLLAGLALEPRERYWGGIIANPEAAEFVYVAESASGEVIGFASGGPERSEHMQDFTSRLYAIYLLEGWQRGGIGRRLVLAVVGGLLARGHESMMLWVLADNPARGFYERLGGSVFAEQLETFGGVELRELAFGWSALQHLNDVLSETT